MRDIKITINLDADGFTWKDIKAVESGSPTKIYEVVTKYGAVEGVPVNELEDFLDNLSIQEMRAVTQVLVDAVAKLRNPTDETGKNSNGVSPNISSTKRVRRR